jgi:hypothetical protein
MKTWQTLAFVVAGMAIGSSPLHAQTTLRFKFKEGDKFAYALEQRMKISSSQMGKDVTVNMNQDMKMSWQVLKVDDQGRGKIKVAITEMKMSMDGPMGQLEVDSKNPKELNDPVGKVLNQVVTAISGMEMTFTADPTGDIKEVKIPEKVTNDLKALPGAEMMGELFSEAGLKKMAHGGIEFPKEAIDKGKSWSHKADMKLPLGQIKGEVQFTYEGPVERDGKKLEKIALKPNVTIEAAPDAPFKMKLKSQEGKGHFFFDNDAGRIVAVDSSQTMEMIIDVNGMQIPQKIEQNTMMKLVK